MPKKLMLSLTLTPLTDRFLMGIFNVNKATVSNEDNIYGETTTGGMSPQQKLESVEQLIVFFKFCMVVSIYVYSTYIKQYRESFGSFADDDTGLTKIIDSMIKKIK